jgi:hypothetical protein
VSTRQSLRDPPPGCRDAAPLDSTCLGRYIHGHGGVAKLVIALACQAGGRGFKSRRSRSFFSGQRIGVPCTAAPQQVHLWHRRGCIRSGINRGSQRAVAQLVARSVRDRKAGGSNPPSPTHVHVNFRTGLIYSPCHLKARAFRIPSKLTLCQALWRLTAGFSALARHLVDLLRNAAWQGFVWGGSWSVFDTMHFEYRPEILLMRASPGSCEQEEY